jgi:hypothetical protein
LFIVGFVVLAFLIGWAEYSFGFKELLTYKDSQIQTLRDQLEAERRKNAPTTSSQSPSPTPTPPPRVPPTDPSKQRTNKSKSGPSTKERDSAEDRSVKIGDGNRFSNSPVITGDGNTVRINDDWSLTIPQQDTLRNSLAPFSASVRIWEVFNDRHSHSFSEGFGKLLNNLSGWDAEWGNGEVQQSFPGIVIEVSHTDFPAAAEIQKQLRGMGIPASGTLTKGLPSNQIVLHIGTRP